MRAAREARLEKLLARLNALEERDEEHQVELLRIWHLSTKYWLVSRYPDGEAVLHGSSEPADFSRLELYAYLSRRVGELEVAPTLRRGKGAYS